MPKRSLGQLSLSIFQWIAYRVRSETRMSKMHCARRYALLAALHIGHQMPQCIGPLCSHATIGAFTLSRSRARVPLLVCFTIRPLQLHRGRRQLGIMQLVASTRHWIATKRFIVFNAHEQMPIWINSPRSDPNWTASSVIDSSEESTNERKNKIENLKIKFEVHFVAAFVDLLLCAFGFIARRLCKYLWKNSIERMCLEKKENQVFVFVRSFLVRRASEWGIKAATGRWKKKNNNIIIIERKSVFYLIFDLSQRYAYSVACESAMQRERNRAERGEQRLSRHTRMRMTRICVQMIHELLWQISMFSPKNSRVARFFLLFLSTSFARRLRGGLSRIVAAATLTLTSLKSHTSSKRS